MGVRERKQHAKEQLHQSILDVARELFIREGYENVSMRKIAQQIEYSPTTIYLYFKDKNELINHLNQESCAILLEMVGKAHQIPVDDPLLKIANGMRAYINFGLNYPNHYKLIFMSDLGRSIYCGRDGTNYQAYDSLRIIVSECINQGKIRSNDVELISEVIWGANHGIVSLMIVHPHFPWKEREQLINETIMMVIQGLKA